MWCNIYNMVWSPSEIMNSWDLPKNEEEEINFITDVELFQANATKRVSILWSYASAIRFSGSAP